MLDLTKKPFYLNESDINWVEKTKDAMTLEEKIGQLFCIMFGEGTQEEIDFSFNILKPGGCMYRTLPMKNAITVTNRLRQTTDIPLLISANLEKGGNGIIEEGTFFGSQMEVAATDDVDTAEKLSTVCAKEGRAVGANWSFSPIIDIDTNFRNPITNTRTFGSDPERVRDMGVTCVKTMQSLGIAASIKHFPGDGRDERDQHLVTSINDCSCEEWDETYGMVYKACIDAGALTCMAAQIMQPAYSKKLNPGIKDEDIMPATLSKELLNGLLRQKLGFNGMVVTDASTMAGFMIPMPREKAVPYCIEAGCDMFLFAKNLQEDYDFMLNGVKNGILSEKRLEEAVTRILATKAALGLHKETGLIDEKEAAEVVGCEQHKEWAKQCADRSVTLVKEQDGVLPLSTDRYKKILFYELEHSGGIGPYQVKEGVCRYIREKLADEGFEMTAFVPPQDREGHTPTNASVTDVYDAIIYVANIGTKSNQTTVRVEWAQPLGSNCPHFITSVPTIFISVENPYHLLDVPRVKTFINTYCSDDIVLDALIEKLMGRSEFKGVNPVDPFCGKWDAKL